MKLSKEIAAVLAEDVSTLAVLQDSELSSAVLKALKIIDFPNNLGMLPDEASKKVFTMMREVIASLPEILDVRFMDDLAADFAAIYLTGALNASPYESYWLSEDHLLCQDAMFDMRTLYASSGLRAPDWRKRPDDHLVFQLQFLARLLAKVRTDHDWRALANFLDYHLLLWLPDFASRVANRCDTPFYAALAVLTNGWCQQLRELTAWHLNEARPSPEDIEEHLHPKKVVAIQEVPIHFVPGGAGPSW